MFTLVWTKKADETYQELKAKAQQEVIARKRKQKTKSSQAGGLFKQVQKTITHLSNNPKHPGLQTHEYDSITNPYDSRQKVFEAYVQNNTSGACRVFWCYGPKKGQITIIAITPHP